MRIKPSKNKFLIGLSIFFLLIFFNLKKTNADDDEENLQIIDTDRENSQVQTITPTTAKTNVNANTTQEVTTTVKLDSDGDGLLDDIDPHPAINENFIVKDNNLNGIDDRYEQAIVP